MKEDLELEMKWTAARNEFIVGIYLHQQYHSTRFWNTSGKILKEHNRLGSEIIKLKVVREQTQLLYLRLGFK